jgi:hypothetical protein
MKRRLPDMARTGMNGALPAFLLGVYIVHDRFPLQPQHWRLRSFLADLLGGAALWAVSAADAGKRVVCLSTEEAFSGRLCRLDLGFALAM